MDVITAVYLGLLISTYFIQLYAERDKERQKEKRKQQLKQKELQKLKEQKAFYGVHTPFSCPNKSRSEPLLKKESRFTKIKRKMTVNKSVLDSI